MVNYKEYMKSTAWKMKRLDAFMKHGKRCYLCDCINGIIQVHHITYERLGRERMSDLIVLCKYCHDHVHGYHKKKRER